MNIFLLICLLVCIFIIGVIYPAESLLGPFLKRSDNSKKTANKYTEVSWPKTTHGESKGHILKWFDTDMGRVFDGIGKLGTFEVKQFNDVGEFIGIKVSQKFKYPAAYEKGYGGFIYPYEYIPPYLEVSRYYAAQFAGKTITDAAELVGNYGQTVHSIPYIKTAEQKQKEPNLSGYIPTREMYDDFEKAMNPLN